MKMKNVVWEKNFTSCFFKHWNGIAAAVGNLMQTIFSWNGNSLVIFSLGNFRSNYQNNVCSNHSLSKWLLMSCDNMSTHVSGTPGRHQCMQSWPQTATASFFPNQIAGWASALYSLRWVRSSFLIFLPFNASSMTWLTSLASLFTPLLLGSNHESSCQGITRLASAS